MHKADGNHWGQYTLVDAHDCNPQILRDLNANADFAHELCEKLDAAKQGELLLENFGGDPPDPRIHGPSFAQAIKEKGLIQGHCPTHPRLACIDVLKDGDFDPAVVEQLTKRFFKAHYTQTMTTMRGDENEIAQVHSVRDSSRPEMQWEQHIEQLTADESSSVNATINALFAAYIDTQSWGQHTWIDLYGCDTDITNDPERIAEFNEEICMTIAAARYGEPIIDNFGDGEEASGWSFAQLIETSLVQGHFPRKGRLGLIDVFSCRQFNCKRVAQDCADYFRAENYSTATVLRGAPSKFPVIWHNVHTTRFDMKWLLNETSAQET